MKKYLLVFSTLYLFTFFFSTPFAYGASVPVAQKDAVTSNDSASVYVTKTASNIFFFMEDFRNTTYSQIVTEENNTKKEIDSFGVATKSINSKNVTLDKPLDGVQKPIAYVKLFLLYITAFIFSTQVVFYGFFALILFFVLRFIYYKI